MKHTRRKYVWKREVRKLIHTIASESLNAEVLTEIQSSVNMYW